MGQVVYYVAMSLDGFIADDEGSVNWLEQFPMEGVDVGYDAFYQTVGAIIMGAVTYEQVLGFGAYPYPDVESFIITSRELSQPEGGQVTFWQDGLANLITTLKTRHEKDIWVVGGGQLAGAFEDAQLIDIYDITVVPVLLRAGIPLLAPSAKGTCLQACKLIDHTAFANGMMRLRYQTIRD